MRLAPPEYELILSADRVRSRAEMVRQAVSLRREGGGLGAYSGSPDQDMATGRAEIAWRILRAWDAEHVVAPLLAELSAREAIVAYPGASELEHFSFRASLREMIRTAVVESDVLMRLPSLPLWHVRAFDRLFGISATNTLPLVDPARTVVLLAPLAAEGGFLQRLSRLPRPVARRVLEQSPAQLQQIQRIHTLETLLRELARDTGVELVSPVTRADLLEHLSPPCAGRSLILVAHQDEHGLHLHDGPLDLGTLRAAFSERIKAGAPTYDSVLLAVCLAEEPSNLAVCFQAAGCPVVISHGFITFYGRVLALLACALEILMLRGPRPLPSLVDEAWLSTSPVRLRG
ncbi:hypothetical protein [Polyangium jinanense]|uniref:Uncharacterized protein n=1 Tax=Polyangium jinanense TaxID=2829994 RepID=A0A9X3X567_9BACT|nr:hypothetical protein [Polyangium jinanense]MDC3960901.1 hypothetical protein [Polyangium jinanense]MDC3984492.1 hypothetical protein [Polyangium jinanense]